MVLYGQHQVDIDTDGYWVLPEPLKALADGSVVTAGLDGCLWLYPAASWQSFVERASARLALTNALGREFARHVFGNARELAAQNGQLQLPASLRQLEAISSEMIVVGMIDHLELWSPQRWQAQLARATQAWEAELAALGV